MIVPIILVALAVSVNGCGQKSFHQGVVSGTTAQPNAWPWQVQLTRNGRHFCGGSLIKPNWIVTAAHCVTDRSGRPQSASGLTIRLGGHRRSGYEQSAQTISASRIIVHSGYKNLRNDIALVRLSSSASLSSKVNTVCLPGQGQKAQPGGNCYITGWGRTMGGGSLAGTLQQARMPIIADSTCRSAMSKLNPYYDTASMVCAGIKNNPVSGCQGDSGGPFVCQEGGRWVLRGAVSWGDQNCKAGQTFTAFARVSNFASWISSNTGGTGPNPPNPTSGPQPPTQGPPNPGCKDNSSLCIHMKHFCGNPMAPWVVKNCKKTCGNC